MPTTPRKPRQPTDSTLRNVRAANKKIAALERRMDSFFELWSRHERQLIVLTQELRKAAKRR